MTTILAMLFYVGWRMWEGRKARLLRVEDMAATVEMRERINNIEETLKATPFVHFKPIDHGTLQ